MSSDGSGSVPPTQFSADHTYENVFLIFVDAGGHSSVVASNPRDRAGHAYDLFQERVTGRLQSIVGLRRCARAQLWRWAGDGGFLAVHDDDESVARDVVLDYVRSLLELDLSHLRDEFTQLGILGQLHLRIAVHRGVIRYRGEGLEGSIYSPDINFAAHLEKVTPADMVSISEEVYRVAGPFSSMFELAGAYEGRMVYLFPGSDRRGSAARAWLAVHGLAGGRPVHGYHQRPSQQEKSRLVEAAGADVIDLGAALRTASRYLVTTERPAYFRDAILGFLERGGRYRCVLMDPVSAATQALSTQRNEDMRRKIEGSLAAFRQFKDRAGNAANGLEVYQTDGYPGMACLAVDVTTPDALLLTSPYLAAPPGYRLPIELCEMPHYLVSPAAGSLFDELRDLVLAFCGDAVNRVL